MNEPIIINQINKINKWFIYKRFISIFILQLMKKATVLGVSANQKLILYL